MEQLTRNTAATVTVGPFLSVDDGVTPVEDLAATMTVYLSKDGGAFAARASTGTITYSRDGFYLVPLSAADVGAVGRLRLQVTNESVHLPVWENYNVVGVSTYSDPSGAGSLYVTEAEVRAKKIGGEVVDLSAYTDDELAAEINRACRLIDAVTGDIFYSLTEAIDFDGPGMTRLFFPPKRPYILTSVSYVWEMDADGATVLYRFTEGEEYKRYNYFIETLTKYDYDSPRLRFASGGRWPRGQQNIRVCGQWGPSSTPSDISWAAMMLTLEGLMPGSSGMTSADYRQVTWPDFTVTFGGSEKYYGQATGYPAVDRVLERYLNHASMFLAVPNTRPLYEGPLNAEGR